MKLFTVRFRREILVVSDCLATWKCHISVQMEVHYPQISRNMSLDLPIIKQKGNFMFYFMALFVKMNLFNRGTFDIKNQEFL